MQTASARVKAVGTGVSPEGSRGRPLSDNVAGGRAIGKTLSHFYRLKRRAQRGCVAGFLGHAPLSRGPGFATYEGCYPLQIP